MKLVSVTLIILALISLLMCAVSCSSKPTLDQAARALNVVTGILNLKDGPPLTLDEIERLVAGGKEAEDVTK